MTRSNWWTPADEMSEWLKGLTIVGFEESEKEKQAREAAERKAAEEEEDDEDEDEEDEDDDELSDEEKELDPKVKAILKKERTARKEAERREKAERQKRREAAKKARRGQREADKGKQKEDDDKEKSDAQKARDEANTHKERADRLQVKLRTQALDAEVMKQAQGMGFRDIDDAVRLVIRDEDMVEGEDDDISVDEDAVKDALEELAQKKPHLIADEEEEEDENRTRSRSGSKFGGKKKGTTDKPSEEHLRDKYPALGPSRKAVASREVK